MLNKTTVSIIGCGWLGYPLALFLKEKGYKVKGSSRNEQKLLKLETEGIEPFKIEVKNRLIGENISSFFDSEILIINIPPGRRHPNVETYHPLQIKAIIEAASKGQVQKVLFVSSTGVYGNENKIVTEEDALRPIRNSGKALVIIEKYLNSLKQLDITIARMAGLVGGDRKAGRFLAGKTNIPNGGALVNMVHRDDCIRVLYEIVRQEKWGKIYNICADKHPTRKAFYKAQAKKDGFEAPHFVDESEGSYKIISNEKMKKELAYRFLHPDPMTFP